LRCGMMNSLPIKIFGKSRFRLPFPYLLDVQKDGWKAFWDRYLSDLLEEISPIRDYTKKEFELWFTGYKLGEPNYPSDLAAKTNDDSLEAPLRVKVRLSKRCTLPIFRL